MRRQVLSVLGVLIILFGTGCDRSQRASGIDGATPLIEEFVAAAEGLTGLGPTVAAADTVDARSLAKQFQPELKAIGAAALRVLNRAEPEGPAGVAAVQQALQDAAAKVIRSLVTAAGGTDAGDGRLIARPPHPIGFAIGTPDFALHRDRSTQGKAEGRSVLRGDLSRQIEQFVYVALLADPVSRNRLAPRLSPEDLPKSVDRSLDLAAGTTEQWRQQIFDPEDRLMLPSSFDAVRWKGFLAWALAVNPSLVDPATRLTEPAFAELFV